MATQDFFLDKRIVQRSIEKGRVDPKAYAKGIASLPDMAGNAELTVIDDDDAKDETSSEEE